MTQFDQQKYLNIINAVDPMRLNGKVVQVVGLLIESQGPLVQMGEVCTIHPPESQDVVLAEVVGFRQERVLLMPLGELTGIAPGCEVRAFSKSSTVKVGTQLLGRVLDALGNPLDDKGQLFSNLEYPLQASPPPLLSRKRITDVLSVGVRAIDGLLTMGQGQRIGIMAGSGVGKSTLLGMIARNTSADINVIALVGERGREVKEFLERDLGEAGLKRSVIVVATSDQPALLRIKSAMTATAIAEYFRDSGKNVMLMMDSVTRFAMAQREVGLTVGEPPATRGYTPSVFALLPRLLERAGTSATGSITGIYTVLVDGDDMNEPIADAVRSILDGHIVLSREIAAMNHYPAIDVLNSVSRLMLDLASGDHWQSAQKVRSLLAVYKEAEDLINIGAYVDGSNPLIDEAIKMIGDVRAFLQQSINDRSSWEETISQLEQLASG